MFYHTQIRPRGDRTNGRLDIATEMGFPVPMRVPSRRRATSAALALLVAVALLPAAGIVTNGPVVRAATEIRPRITGIQPLDHEVYGYLPYWRLDSGTVDRIQYDLVSTIAFFGLGIKSTGALDTNWVGYKAYVGDDAAAVTNAAHDRGVRVVPTFQLFDSSAGYLKMTKFLKSPAAQDTFIAQALDLMAARKADGAGLDFEPVGGLNPLGVYYVPFVAKFAAAMKARFPDAQLVNATSVGASQRIITGLVPSVDRQMVMTYNYRYAGSTVTGAIAPLDHALRNVKIHMDRILQWAPASSLLLGVPYYGYDWPVTSTVPNATVQSDKTTYGAVRSVTYASARDYLAAHPTIVRHYDALEGSGYYTYRDSARKTYRQVYFEDEHSLAAKYDYTILSHFAGVGIWTLDNDKSYGELWNVLRAKFYAPIHAVVVQGTAKHALPVGGVVVATVHLYATVTGTVPERGILRWTIRDATGKLVRWGETQRLTLYPGRRVKIGMQVRLGTPAALRAGTDTLRVRFISSSRTWYSPIARFLQRY